MSFRRKETTIIYMVDYEPQSGQLPITMNREIIAATCSLGVSFASGCSSVAHHKRVGRLDVSHNQSFDSKCLQVVETNKGPLTLIKQLQQILSSRRPLNMNCHTGCASDPSIL